MKTDILKISSDGSNMETALEQVDKVSAYKELSPRDTLCLRLLAEETMAMMRAITGNVNGEFWMEDEDQVYTLHLRVISLVDEITREKLLSAPPAAGTKPPADLWEKSVPSLNLPSACPCSPPASAAARLRCTAATSGPWRTIRISSASSASRTVPKPKRRGMSWKNPWSAILPMTSGCPSLVVRLK